MEKTKVGLLERMLMTVILALCGITALIQVVSGGDMKYFLGIPILAISVVGLIIYFVWFFLRENPSHAK